MSIETNVASYYTRGRLEDSILRALTQAEKNVANLTHADLAALDEFHVGGLESTQELAAQMELRPGLSLLDVGSGIGGPARYFAGEHGCKVTGIDLTEEFVQVSRSLTRRTKLDHAVEFVHGSALAMPFEKPVFDRAYTIHVCMNIQDKTKVFREVRRVLKPGGLVAIFDLMRTGDGSIRYPVPWALTEETSFVSHANDYRDALSAAGFKVTKERRRGAFALEFMDRMMARMAQGGPSALGLHLLMGEPTKIMLGNVRAMIQEGFLEPIELFARVA
ncbi:MAG TPA: class I SAM-dependent methyltransferase [Candidatus Acidoferrum sp.]|nr:class I SAM-dependent methyltransferase [Candidatus Acidoferrum sp.]